MRLFIFSLLMFFAISVAAQQPCVGHYESSEYFGSIKLAKDDTNNTYVAGNYISNCDLDPFSGLSPSNVGSISSTYYLYRAVFFQKIDPNCNVDWTHTIQPTDTSSNTSFAKIINIQVGPTGNVYITGTIKGDVTYHLTDTTFNLISYNNNPNNFILKLSNDGHLIWIKKYDYTTSPDNNAIFEVIDAQVNSQDELIACIHSLWPTIDIDPGPGLVNLANSGIQATTILKLNSNGQLVWWNHIINQTGGFGPQLQLAEDDTIYVSFRISDTNSVLTFNNSTGQTDTIVQATGQNFAIQKISPSGNTVWFKFIQGNIQYYHNNWIDNSSNLYLSIRTNDTVYFDSNGTQIPLVNDFPSQQFLVKLNSNLEYQWSKKYFVIPASNFIDADFDSENNITIGGISLEYSLTLSSNPNVTYTKPPLTGIFSFLVKLDSNGNYLWSKQITGIGAQLLESVKYSNNNLLTIAGNFRHGDTSTGTLNLAIQDTNYVLSTLESTDGFVATLRTCTSDSLIQNIETCNEGYLWNVDSTMYNQSGQYLILKSNFDQCDSVFLLNLIVHPTYSETLQVVACESYTWSQNNKSYAQSGFYYDTLQSQTGCDSIIKLDLTIYPTSSSQEIRTECDNFYWDLDGKTYTQSGTYQATLTNSNGCDSTVTLEVTIKSRTFNTESVSTCEAYTWPINGRTYYQSGNFIDTIVNTQGCDSINSLILKILRTDNNTTVTACNSFVNPITNALELNSGVYSDTFTNRYGCDSIITLNLTINSVSETAISQAQNTIVSANDNASFQWLKCDSVLTTIENENSKSFIPTESGQYAVQLTENGCVDTSACLTVEVIDTSDPEISMYPNPNNGKFTVDLDNAQGATISLYDSRGALVIYRTSKSGIQTFDLEHASGMYNLVVQFGDKLFAKRLIIAF